MNRTTSIIFLNNISNITIESWFIPIDILTSLCILIGIILSSLFFILILINKTCRTIPMMLVANSCLINIIFGINIFSMTFSRFLNDYYRKESIDIYCSFRGYVGYSTCSILNNSFFLQAIYRFFRIIYPTCLYIQTYKFVFIFIFLTWIFAFSYPLIFLFTNEINYNKYNQICQLELHLSFSIIYMASFAYIIPVLSTMFVYIKLIFYVKKMSQRITPMNILSRAKKELKMVQRIVILVSILVIYCFPYALFIFLSFGLTISIYHFRISYLFVMIILYQFTDPLKISIKNIIHRKTNEIVPTIAMNN